MKGLQTQFSVALLSKKIFLLNEFTIDPQRGELIGINKIEQIEPKVMAVLLFLASHHGEVVDPEALFSHVWPKSIYSPGSIRRCIAVLRKAISDNNKSIIVTHPKRGYSLQATISLPVKPTNPAVTANKRSLLPFTLSILTLFIVAMISYQLINQSNKDSRPTEITSLNVTKILPLTATDHFEHYSRYSPDSQYIAFLRAEDSTSLSYKTLWHIWIRDLNSDNEYQLTSQAGHIRSFSWSMDSKALLYLVREQETVNVFRLANKPLQQNTPTIKVLTRKNIQRITAIHWGRKNQLYYIAKTKGVSTLFTNNLTNGEQKQLLSSDDVFHPYELSISYSGEKLAVLGFNKQMHSQVKVISLISDEIKIPESLVTLNSNRYFISWHPNNKNILLSDGRHLFNLNANGNVNKIGFENFTYVRHPQFSPDGKKIALTLENIDEDIWLHDLTKTEKKRLVVNSNTSDFHPRFSPSGKQFAFVSSRKGYPQLYIHDLASGKNSLAFANPKQNLSIYPPVWHPNGKKIASATNEQPFVINVTDDDITVEMLTYTQGVPLQWYYQEEALLISHQKEKIRIFAKIELGPKKLVPLRSKENYSGYLNHQNELLLISKKTITNTHTNNKVSLVGSGYIQRSFANNNGVYLKVTKEEQHWLYFFSYQDETLSKVTTLDNDQYIATISQQSQYALMETQRIEKDIVILTLAE